ncbi:MAG: hypothetical protein JWQ27_840 [Ferruginibacter sp.]|nr:hypothetical protein [Ferruginibacter sp.]
MNKKWLIACILLILALSWSIYRNMQLNAEVAELNARINRFLPAAQDLEKENARLQEQELQLKQTISELQSAGKKPAAQEVQQNPPTEVNPTPQIPVTEPFKDLNKRQH